MGENSSIQWTDHTFNPWIGCTKVGPGCDHCYAEALDKRWYGASHWGPGQPRRRTTEANWRKPLAWNRDAERNGTRPRVFCASLADVFDNEVPSEWRRDLFDVIRATPHLDWQIVTKRIGNAAKMLPADWGDGWPHVILIATVVNQAEADRDVPKLLATRAAARGLSYEPALGPIDFSVRLAGHCPEHDFAGGFCIGPCPSRRYLDWIIIGGESAQGAPARRFDVEWARSVLRQCAARRRPPAVFVKQLGSNPTCDDLCIALRDRAGGDITEWPTDLQIREFPYWWDSTRKTAAGTEGPR